MIYGKWAFYTLTVLAACGAAVLMYFAQLDMMEMRKIRPAFNFDGIIAFLSGVFIAGGLVVLFPLWRIFAFTPATAQRDLKIWIGVLWAVFISLHLVFIASYLIDEWVNTPDWEVPFTAVKDVALSADAILLYVVAIWPLAAIFGLSRYRRSLQ